MFITDDVRYIGVNDHKVDLFEGQYVVPGGMAYNSYVILDEKIAVMDTVSRGFEDEWLNNLEAELSGRTPDYLIVSHMEPDHSANIALFLEKYPNAVAVATAQAFKMIKNFFGDEYAERRIVAADKSSLCLGKHELTFVTAPMIHWPEVMMTYMADEKLLFSADAFGKFGALDIDEEWDCEARRYYIGIVGKFGPQVQAFFKKVSGIALEKICPLHGPVLTENLEHYLGLYNTWSSYEPETKGTAIAYTSVYGNTKKAALMLKDMLEGMGKTVECFDLARDDMAEGVENAFRYESLVLATTTYNGDIFPFMKEFINHLTERNYQKRSVGIIENGSWAPMAAKVIKNMLSESKDLNFLEPVVTVRSAVSKENETQLMELAKALCK